MMGRPFAYFLFFTDGRSFPSFFLVFCVSCFSGDREEFGLQHYNAPSLGTGRRKRGNTKLLHLLPFPRCFLCQEKYRDRLIEVCPVLTLEECSRERTEKRKMCDFFYFSRRRTLISPNPATDEVKKKSKVSPFLS